MIDEVYGRIQALEPWCRDVRPVTDIAVVQRELVLGGRAQEPPPGVQGVTRCWRNWVTSSISSTTRPK